LSATFNEIAALRASTSSDAALFSIPAQPPSASKALQSAAKRCKALQSAAKRCKAQISPLTPARFGQRSKQGANYSQIGKEASNHHLENKNRGQKETEPAWEEEEGSV